MHLKNVLACSALVCGGYLSSTAQSFVPPNMDFELGTTANWTYLRGTVALNHVFTLAPSPAVPGLHTIMSGSGTDMYGGFPVVGHGTYSLKLAHDTIDNNADAAAYIVHVPVGGVYRLDYHYAAVLQNIIHPASEQAIMKVTAIDSATGMVLSDSLEVLPSSTGFSLSSTGTGVYYKPWTAASINLAGYGGHTIIVTAAVASCGTGAHFGYGYFDVTGVTMTSTTSAPLTNATQGTINVFPNPASGAVHLQWAGQAQGIADMQITDVTGRVVNHTMLNMNTAAGETVVSTSDLNNGIYFVTIKSATINYNSRLVIQK